MRGVHTVSDLTDEHHGWVIKIRHGSEMVGGILGPDHRTLVIGKGFGCGIRAWERPDGTAMVGICDDDRSPGIVGREWAYPADTPCELLRQIKKPRKRR